MRKKILSFGELLLRIAPEADWIDTHQTPFFVGGAESNVATALAGWQLPVALLTAVPDNHLTHDILNHLEWRGVDVSKVIFRGDRLGLYYLSAGKDVKHAGVIYDRKHSSFSELTKGMIDWEGIFHDVSWFNFSAIAPALSESIAAVCLEAVEYASANGITVSVDLNYRARLWQYGMLPIDIMPGLVSHCDVVMGNIWAAEKMLGIPIDPLSENALLSDYHQRACKTSEILVKTFSKVKTVANTFRFDTDTTRYSATLYHAGSFTTTPEQTVTGVLDRVGTGDCFMAGLIRGLYVGHNDQQTLEFATAAAINKFFVRGDTMTKSVEDILSFQYDKK